MYCIAEILLEACASLAGLAFQARQQRLLRLQVLGGGVHCGLRRPLLPPQSDGPVRQLLRVRRVRLRSVQRRGLTQMGGIDTTGAALKADWAVMLRPPAPRAVVAARLLGLRSS